MTILRILIRMIGLISLVLSCWGFYDLARMVRRVLIYPVHIPEAPFFQQVFWAMALLNVAFLVSMSVAAIGLLRVKRSAVRFYTWLYFALVIYTFAPGMMWGPGSLGSSIAAASGVGSVGIESMTLYPIPFLYAAVSILLVNLAMRKLGGASSDTLQSQAI
jgi:hypothetical protein